MLEQMGLNWRTMSCEGWTLELIYLEALQPVERTHAGAGEKYEEGVVVVTVMVKTCSLSPCATQGEGQWVEESRMMECSWACFAHESNW